MARGFLAGALWGVVVSGVVAGVASVLIPLPQERRGALTVPVVPQEAETVAQPGQDPQDAQDPQAEPEDEAAEPDEAPAVADVARRPAVEEPVVPADAPRVEVSDDAEVDPQEAGELSTAPRPDAETEEVALVDPPAEQTIEKPQALEGAPQVDAVDSPQLQVPQVADEISISTDPVQPRVPDVPADDSGFAQREPEEDQAPRLPQVGQDDATDEGEDLRPAIGKPAVSLVDRDAEAEGEAEPSTPREVVQGAARPLEKFAAPVAVAQDKPQMAIILIDDGQGPLGAEAIEAFPFPVSLAVQADAPDAAERATRYRSRGFEVLAMLDVPQGATAADTEVAVSAALGAVPDVIGLIEGIATGLQGSRDVSAQVAQALLASGHGLVMLPNGLNTAQALAAREGVPSVTVFRDFDGEGQDNRVKRRFLDQAAFKARQDGQVVMLGRMSADTISALLLWGLQDRASSVALVPVSAILLAPEPE